MRGLCAEGSLLLRIHWAVAYSFLLRILGQLPSTSPRRGNLMAGFLRYRFGGLLFGEAYFWNFTVSH